MDQAVDGGDSSARRRQLSQSRRYVRVCLPRRQLSSDRKLGQGFAGIVATGAHTEAITPTVRTRFGRCHRESSHQMRKYCFVNHWLLATIPFVVMITLTALDTRVFAQTAGA